MVRPITESELESVLPLIEDYQRFYRVAQPQRDHNREFFRRFLEPSREGVLLGAWDDSELVGFACLYWTFSSVRATDVVLLNDLLVRPDTRGRGVGLELIEAARDVARDRGVPLVRWWTEVSNERAQRLYDRTGARRSAWYEYELDA